MYSTYICFFSFLISGRIEGIVLWIHVQVCSKDPAYSKYPGAVLQEGKQDSTWKPCFPFPVDAPPDHVPEWKQRLSLGLYIRIMGVRVDRRSRLIIEGAAGCKLDVRVGCKYFFWKMQERVEASLHAALN